MIQGLKLIVGSAELQEFAERRAKHHEKRVGEFELQRTQLGETYKQFKDAASIPGAASNSTLADQHDGAVNRLTEKINHHTSRARWFSFVATHLHVGAFYELEARDLETLEIDEQDPKNYY